MAGVEEEVLKGLPLNRINESDNYEVSLDTSPYTSHQTSHHASPRKIDLKNENDDEYDDEINPYDSMVDIVGTSHPSEALKRRRSTFTNQISKTKFKDPEGGGVMVRTVESRPTSTSGGGGGGGGSEVLYDEKDDEYEVTTTEVTMDNFLVVSRYSRKGSVFSLVTPKMEQMKKTGGNSDVVVVNDLGGAGMEPKKKVEEIHKNRKVGDKYIIANASQWLEYFYPEKDRQFN